MISFIAHIWLSFMYLKLDAFVWNDNHDTNEQYIHIKQLHKLSFSSRINHRLILLYCRPLWPYYVMLHDTRRVYEGYFDKQKSCVIDNIKYPDIIAWLLPSAADIFLAYVRVHIIHLHVISNQCYASARGHTNCMVACITVAIWRCRATSAIGWCAVICWNLLPVLHLLEWSQNLKLPWEQDP